MSDNNIYSVGWNDCINYNRELNQLKQSRFGFGTLFFIAGIIFTIMAFGAPVITYVLNQHIYNWAPLLYMGWVGIIFLVFGYFIDKTHSSQYKIRMEAHTEKWSARWNNFEVKVN